MRFSSLRFGVRPEGGQPDIAEVESERRFEAVLRRERDRADRTNDVLSMLAIDPAPEQFADPDWCRRLERVLRACLRSTDTAGWLPGQRIGVSLPHTPVSEVWTLLKRMRARLEPKGRTSLHFDVYTYAGQKGRESEGEKLAAKDKEEQGAGVEQGDGERRILRGSFSRMARSVRSIGLRGLLFSIVAIVIGLGAMNAQTPPAGFVLEEVLVDLDQPIGVRFLPDGRMLLLFKKGRIEIVDVGASPVQSSEYLDLNDAAHSSGIEFGGERGLLDIAIDPGFSSDPGSSSDAFIYLFYTPAFGSSRIARFTHQENSGGLTSTADPTSEVALWQDTEGYDSCCHYGGGLDFGPEGNLWLTTGDHFQGSYAASLEKAGGGVIRIEKDGSIPAGNPFQDGNGPLVDSKFAYGLRNPFRARWDIPRGLLFIAEVGGNEQMRAWEDLHVIRYDSTTGRFVDGDFGTASDNGVFDGIDFGWPTVEGLPPHVDFPAADIQPIAEPIFAWKHDGLTSAINGGVVYRGSMFPAEYDAVYFYADSTRDFVRYLKFNPDGSIAPNPSPDPISSQNPDSTSYSFDLASFGRIVSMDVGPDGALYYASFTDSGGAYGQSNPTTLGSVRRYIYDAGNGRPVLSDFTALPGSGLPPLAVTFTIEATDPEADPMSLTLDFDDGTPPVSQALPDATPITIVHTYDSDGLYQAVLEVTDGQAICDSREISVGTKPVIESLTSSNSNPNGEEDIFRFGDVMTFDATATDAEDGTLPGENFTWTVSFVRPGNIHPALGPVSGTTSIDFPIPAQGQGFSGMVLYRCYLTVRDSSGLTTTQTIDIFPDKVDISFGTVPDGIPIQIDGNTTRLAPFVLDTLINIEHVITAPGTYCINGLQYDFVGWSNGPSSTQQTYLVPETNSSLTAMYTEVGPCAGPPIDGLVMHLDASSGLTLSGDTVISWQDEIFNNNELLASGTPLRLPAEFNGNDAVHLDGVSASLSRTGTVGLPLGSTDRSLFLVGRYNALSGMGVGWAGFAYGLAAANQAFGLALSPGGFLGVQGWGGGNDILSNPLTNGVGGLLSQAAIYEGGVLTQYRSGAPIGTTNHVFATAGSSIRLGEELNGGRNLDMDVAEVLVYDRAVTDAERMAIEDYLDQRYLITLGGGNAPAIQILAPSNGSSFLVEDLPVQFEGMATDFEDGSLDSSITWTSSLDGLLGIGATLNAFLSEGTHMIVARVEDSDQQQNTDEIDVVVTDTFGGLLTDGLVLHLEADLNVSTLTGNTVAGWLDGSGLGNDMVAGGDPQLVPVGTPSGLPAIHFDGNDKLERIHATDALGGFPQFGADRTMFFLVRYLNSSAWAGVAFGTAAPNETFGLAARHPSGELVLQGFGSGDLISTTQGIGAGWMIQTGMVGGGAGRLFRDGMEIAQWSHTYNTTLTKLVIAAEIKDRGYVTADVAAVLLYDRALSDSERASVETYLSDKYLTANTAPVVSISAPLEGSTHFVSAPVSLTGTSQDTEDGDISAELVWTSDLDGVLGTGASLPATLTTLGAHVITATSTDQGMLVGSSSVMISLVANTAPVVSISEPLDNSTHSVAVPLPLTGSSQDTEDGDISAGLVWTSDLDGALGTGASLPATLTTLGSHVITATSTDLGALVGSASVTVDVVANAAPVVVISAPLDNSTHFVSAPVTLTGSSQDAEDGDISAGLVWTSDRDGALGTGASLPATLTTLGAHVITATSTDQGAESGSSSVTITVVANTAPVVGISSPLDSSTHFEGAPVPLTGSSQDAEDGDISAGLVWTSDRDGALGTGASLPATLTTLGSHVITATSTDQGTLVGSASVTIVVVTNTAPVVGISSPLDNSTHFVSAPVPLTGSSQDTEDGDISAGLVWTSDRDGALGTGASLPTTLTTLGSHVITATSTDQGTLVGSASVTITVVANTAPVVGISSPLDGSTHFVSVPVTLTGSSQDTEDGDISAGLVWTSDRDGALGTGASLPATLTTLGSHVITATSTDLGALVGSTSVTITVAANTAPVVGISAPLDGSTHFVGAPVTLTGSSQDAEDGDISAGLVWTSDRDGALGTGASLPATLTTLGSHVITATSTDQGTLVGSASVTITVVANTAPVVGISSPLDGSTHFVSAPVTLTGSSQDTEDGDIGAGLVWTSDRDGALGTGASLPATLTTLGSHVITATSTDQGTLVGSASVTITVVANTAPVVGIISPLEGSTHFVSAPVTLTGSSQDTEDGDISAGSGVDVRS